MTADDELKAALLEIEDLKVQCKFWRQAAEHAVTGWNDLEERLEAAREVLDTINGNVDAARELLGGVDEWAQAPIEPGVGSCNLRVVEGETPIDFAKIKKDPSPQGFDE